MNRITIYYILSILAVITIIGALVYFYGSKEGFEQIACDCDNSSNVKNLIQNINELKSTVTALKSTVTTLNNEAKLLKTASFWHRIWFSNDGLKEDKNIKMTVPINASTLGGVEPKELMILVRGWNYGNVSTFASAIHPIYINTPDAGNTLAKVFWPGNTMRTYFQYGVFWNCIYVVAASSYEGQQWHLGVHFTTEQDFHIYKYSSGNDKTTRLHSILIRG